MQHKGHFRSELVTKLSFVFNVVGEVGPDISSNFSKLVGPAALTHAFVRKRQFRKLSSLWLGRSRAPSAEILHASAQVVLHIGGSARR